MLIFFGQKAAAKGEKKVFIKRQKTELILSSKMPEIRDFYITGQSSFAG